MKNNIPPIVLDYWKIQDAIKTTKNPSTRWRLMGKANQVLGVMTAKAAQIAVSRNEE